MISVQQAIFLQVVAPRVLLVQRVSLIMMLTRPQLVATTKLGTRVDSAGIAILAPTQLPAQRLAIAARLDLPIWIRILQQVSSLSCVVTHSPKPPVLSLPYMN